MLLLDSQINRLPKKNIRSDKLLVLNEDGEVLKSADFNRILAEVANRNFEIKPELKTEWLNKLVGGDGDTFEKTHVNSFYETYATANGKRVQTGYVIHCNIQKKIVFLDLNLKSVLDVIDTAGRDIHDVQLLNDNQLIFYQNHSQSEPNPAPSVILGFDLKTRKFFDIYQPPAKGAFAVNLEYAPALWNKKNKVVRIGIKGKEMEVAKRPASHLTFLNDVSGSMQTPQKLPHVKTSFKKYVRTKRKKVG